MPTTPIQRLLFAQGGKCFFCQRKLSKSEASVEHLVAVTFGGKDNDENCVACCKTLNNLFGRMSLKEKIRIVLNQTGAFDCPATTSGSTTPSQALAPTKQAARIAKSPAEQFDLVVADLHKRGNARPRTVEKLKNTVRSLMSSLGQPEVEVDSLLEELVARKLAVVEGEKVSYHLPAQ